MTWPTTMESNSEEEERPWKRRTHRNQWRGFPIPSDHTTCQLWCWYGQNNSLNSRMAFVFWTNGFSHEKKRQQREDTSSTGVTFTHTHTKYTCESRIWIWCQPEWIKKARQLACFGKLLSNKSQPNEHVKLFCWSIILVIWHFFLFLKVNLH